MNFKYKKKVEIRFRKYNGPQYFAKRNPKNVVSTAIPVKKPKKYLIPDSIDLKDLFIVKTEFLDPYL